MVKDACVGEYYAIMESSPFFFLNTVCLYGKTVCGNMNTTSATSWANCHSLLLWMWNVFKAQKRTKIVIPLNVFYLFFVSTHFAMGYLNVLL